MTGDRDTWFENLVGGGRSLQILKLCNWWWWVICSTLWPLSWQRLLGTHWVQSCTPQLLWIWRQQIKLLALARIWISLMQSLVLMTKLYTTEPGSVAFSFNFILSISRQTWQPSGVTSQKIWILNIKQFKNVLLH